MDTPFRIFLFEDNDADVFLVRMAIDQAGLPFALTVCTDGEEAMTAVQRIESGEMESPDLLLLDMNLPRFGGDEILDRMRKGAKGRSFKVIVITSSDSPADRERARSLAVEHYFRKPVDLEEFLKLGQVVRAALMKRSASEGAGAASSCATTE